MKKKLVPTTPQNIVFCKRCVISNQRPNSSVEMKNKGEKKQTIAFNQNGICSACLYHEKKKIINWQEREDLLFKLLEKYRSKNGNYDVLVPSSGGKDSSFAAHVLKYKYGMNPLAVTWAPNMFTDIGYQNFTNLSKIGNVDSILVTPNGIVHKLLTKKSFINLGHPFQPFIHGQKVIGPKIAERFNIKLIMYGENQAEYGNPIQENNNFFMDPIFYTNDDPKTIMFGGESISNIIRGNNKINFNDFETYIPLTKKIAGQSNIKVSYLGYFEKWDPQECYYYAVKNTGFKPSDERSEGTYSRYTEIDDKIVPMHFYMTHIKFGIGRASYDASQEIRNEKITRDEGVYLVKKFDGEFPTKYFNDFLDYIDCDESLFFKTVDKFRPNHLWKKNNNNWQLKKAVYS